MVADPLYLAWLAQFDDGAWLRAVDRLQGAMHPVDRAAARVWFHFFPLRLQQALARSDDPAALAQHLRLEGRWRLDEQRDTSHWFLFGHRYWREVRAEVAAHGARAAAPGALDIASQVQAIATTAAARLRVDASWLVGVTAVALRTLQQVGLPDGPETLSVSAGPIHGPDATPDAVVARRRRQSRGWLEAVRRGPRQWTVTFDERTPVQSFPLIDTQHLTTAAALDTRDHRGRDARCTEGPIPVQCRSCSCGTCWVGVVEGAGHLSPVESRERTTIRALGYLDSDEPTPVIRLACMAQAFGPVTLVVPPWNGQMGARLEKAGQRR